MLSHFSEPPLQKPVVMSEVELEREPTPIPNTPHGQIIPTTDTTECGDPNDVTCAGNFMPKPTPSDSFDVTTESYDVTTDSPVVMVDSVDVKTEEPVKEKSNCTVNHSYIYVKTGQYQDLIYDSDHTVL